MSDFMFGLCLILVSLGIVGLVIGVGFIQSYYEMKSFNKFRDPNDVQATFADAFWTELRINSE